MTFSESIVYVPVNVCVATSHVPENSTRMFGTLATVPRPVAVTVPSSESVPVTVFPHHTTSGAWGYLLSELRSQRMVSPGSAYNWSGAEAAVGVP